MDDEDFEKLNKYSWSFCVGYARRSEPEKGSKKINKFLMHREIMNNPKGKIIDHINGDRLDNRRCNLRECSKSQNGANRVSRGTSKYLGVYLKNNTWDSCMTVNRKSIFLGSFEKEEDAAIAYNKGAIKYHGEFAKLNIINCNI